MKHDISAITPLAETLAAVAKRLIGQKPGITDLISLILTEGGTVKAAVEGIKDVPGEFLDLDREEGQALAALITQKMGPVADQTLADELVGEMLLMVPEVRDGILAYKEFDSWEDKGTAIGQVLSRAGRLVDLVKSMKTPTAA